MQSTQWSDLVRPRANAVEGNLAARPRNNGNILPPIASISQHQAISILEIKENVDSNFEGPSDRNGTIQQQTSSEPRAHSSMPAPTAGEEAVGNSLEFVNSHGPPGKRDAASAKRIRKHVMLQVRSHKLRQATKVVQSKPSDITEERSSSTQRCTCNRTHMTKPRGGEPHPSSQYPRRFPEENSQSHSDPIDPRAYPGGHTRWAKEMTIGFSNLALVCDECRKLWASSPTDDRQALVVFTPNENSLRNTLDATAIDPFANMTIRVTHRMHEMIHHFIHILGPSINPHIYDKENIQQIPILEWHQLAVGDEAALYAMIAQAAYHRLLCANRAVTIDDHTQSDTRGPVREAAFFLFECMRLLQEKIDNPKDALSHNAIFVASSLAACVGYVANNVQLQAHHNGMVKMVELRGGIDTLPRIVAHNVSRIDSNTAWVQKTRPRFPMYKSKFRGPGSAESVLGLNYCGSPFNDKYLEDFLWTVLFSIASDLLYLTHLLDLRIQEPRKIGRKEREYFEDIFAACQHGLSDFPHPSDALVKTTMFYRQNCWRAAALIFMNTAMRTCPSPKLMSTMTSRLIESFQESDMSSLWHPHTDVMLWALFMGYIGAWDTFEKGWFMHELRRVVKVLNLRSFEEMEWRLKSFLYRQSTYKERLRKLWEDLVK